MGLLKKTVLAVCVGVVTAIVIYVIGAIVEDVGVNWTHDLGVLLKGFAVILGLVAGVWYFLTGQTPTSAV